MFRKSTHSSVRSLHTTSLFFNPHHKNMIPHENNNNNKGVAASESSSPSQEHKRQHTASYKTKTNSLSNQKTQKEKAIKVKKKAPWGVQQLRDAWSEEAMSKLSNENMSERIHRAYRYHPEERRRYFLKLAGIGAIPTVLLGVSLGYYYYERKPIWQGDPQHLFNLIRALDTSPRSTLHLYRLEEHQELPPHVLAYRQEHWQERIEKEKIFKLTGSAFRRLSEDERRLLALEEGGEAVA